VHRVGRLNTSNRRTGGVLILVGVALVLGTLALLIFGSSGSPAALELAELLSGVSLGMIGLGTAILGVDGQVFGRTLARRSLKLLGAGLIGDAVLIALAALPDLQGWRVMVLFIPFFIIGWATVIGLALTVVALLAAGGRPRIVGAVFLVAPVLLLISSVLPYHPGAAGGPLSPLAIAFGAAAGGSILLGFAGVGMLAIGAPRGGTNPTG